MPIDTSMYGNLQAPDFAGAIDRGMRLADLAKQRRESAELKEAYKAGVVQNPDGTTTVDRAKTFSALAGKGFAKEAMQFDRDTLADQQSKIESRFKQANMIAQLTADVKDQASWDSAIGKAKELGLDVSQVPKPFQAQYVQNLRDQALTIQERQARSDKDRQFALQEKELQQRALDRAESRNDRLSRETLAREDKNHTLATPYGLANTATDANDLKTAFESKRSFDAQLQEMIDLRKKHNGGAVLNREDVARGKQLSKDLLLEYKNMAKLGVLSKSDEDIINAIIPEDPLQYNSPLAAVQGQDPTLARLEKFKASKDQEFQTKVGTRLRSGVQNIARESTPKPEASTQSAPPKPGTVVDGYVFLGGEPSDQSRWKKTATVARKRD